jgi:hypothetical protein
LGANPEESWQSARSGFNWASDKRDGLARDFPKARILLYQYESAWTGTLKVKQFLGGLATNLLYGLKATREVRHRPETLTFDLTHSHRNVLNGP